MSLPLDEIAIVQRPHFGEYRGYTFTLSPELNKENEDYLWRVDYVPTDPTDCPPVLSLDNLSNK